MWPKYLERTPQLQLHFLASHELFAAIARIQVYALLFESDGYPIIEVDGGFHQNLPQVAFHASSGLVASRIRFTVALVIVRLASPWAIIAQTPHAP
jgi:hypothetical protein